MDIARVDLNLLKALDALLAEASVSGAARRLGLSQPATSAALSRLRTLVGDPLLVRRGNTMVPTTRAEELRPEVASLLEAAARLLNKSGTFDPSASQRKFRILASEYASLVLLGPLAQRLRQAAPNVVVEILPLDRRFEDQLAQYDCDLAIGHRDFLQSTRHIETLLTERYVSVARADHPRLPEQVTLEEFLAEDHAMVTATGRTSGPVDRSLAALGRSRRVVLTVPHYLLAPALFATTDLIMTVPYRIALALAPAHGLRIFSPPLPLPEFDVAFAWHPRSSADPAVTWFCSELRSVSRALLQ
jgi:DNA-binding transcriptional LysR family regulator